jgi:DnaJ-class molecular chaperone
MPDFNRDEMTKLLTGDCYEILGVARDADADTVRKAYRKALLKYHPDKVQEALNKDKAAAAFSEEESSIIDENFKKLTKHLKFFPTQNKKGRMIHG